jgi:hypothetical protein
MSHGRIEIGKQEEEVHGNKKGRASMTLPLSSQIKY